MGKNPGYVFAREGLYVFKMPGYGYYVTNREGVHLTMFGVRYFKTLAQAKAAIKRATQANPARGRSVTLRNMASVTIKRERNGSVRITGRKMAGQRNPGAGYIVRIPATAAHPELHVSVAAVSKKDAREEARAYFARKFGSHFRLPRGVTVKETRRY